MSKNSPGITKRRKRQALEARTEALAVARRLLLERGPHAVTLSNIADQLGVTHANVLYHFGSAADLQTALMESMITDLMAALDDVVHALRTDAGAPRAVIDRVFDAYDKGGAGALAAWIVLSGNTDHLEPVREAVHSLVEAIVEQAGDAEAVSRVRKVVLLISIAAFGDAVIGPYIRGMLDEPEDAMREMTANILPYFLMHGAKS